MEVGMSERHPYPYQCEGEDCPLCLLESENERLTALVKVLESDDHEWYLQAARIERLQAVVDAVIPLYESGTHLYDCDEALGKALAALENRDE